LLPARADVAAAQPPPLTCCPAKLDDEEACSAAVRPAAAAERLASVGPAPWYSKPLQPVQQQPSAPSARRQQQSQHSGAAWHRRGHHGPWILDPLACTCAPWPRPPAAALTSNCPRRPDRIGRQHCWGGPLARAGARLAGGSGQSMHGGKWDCPWHWSHPCSRRRSGHPVQQALPTSTAQAAGRGSTWRPCCAQPSRVQA